MKRLSDRLDEGAVAIFLFHGVIAEQPPGVRNYTHKHLLADAFRAHLEDLLGRQGHPVSMDEVLESCVGGRPLPPRSFAITFDDGFENNLSVAAPILGALGVPATLYVTSGFVEENLMSWIDRIEHCVDRADAASVPVPWGEEPRSFASPGEKVAFLDEVRREVKRRREIDVPRFVADVFRSCRIPEVVSGDGPLDRKLDWRQVAEWAATPGLTLGGHGHTHAILSFLDDAALEAEVALSLRLLRERAGLEVVHYSYPEGLAHCTSPRVVDALRRHGIRCAPTAIDGLNPPGGDPFDLRRIAVV